MFLLNIRGLEWASSILYTGIHARFMMSEKSNFSSFAGYSTCLSTVTMLSFRFFIVIV